MVRDWTVIHQLLITPTQMPTSSIDLLGETYYKENIILFYLLDVK